MNAEILIQFQTQIVFQFWNLRYKQNSRLTVHIHIATHFVNSIYSDDTIIDVRVVTEKSKDLYKMIV